jgi:creatinine amidohydrolase
VHNIGELGAGDVRERVQAGQRTILVPLGSCERHGNPFTPLGLDSAVVLAVVERAAEQADVLHTPVIPFGVAPRHLGREGEGNGTISLRAGTYRRLVEDVARNLIYQGFERLALVSFHSPNTSHAQELLLPLRERTGALVALFSGRESPRMAAILGSSPEILTSDFEAAMAMALLGERFRRDDYLSHSYEIHAPDWLGPSFSKLPCTGWGVSFKGGQDVFIGMHDYEFVKTVGHDGPRPSQATAEKGSELLDGFAEELAAFIQEFNRLPVEVRDRALDWSD